tara:strand:+ start:298 stop:915 length:618 start_codon:yes stop_codon:yes gene_type:complete
MKMENRTWLILALVLLLLIGTSLAQVSARSIGVTETPFGCVCHSGSASDDVTITLNGVPSNYSVNDMANLTVTITGGPEITNESANHGGFNLIVSAGELSSLDNTTQIIDGEATHTTFGNNQRIWHIKWASPSNNHEDVTFTAHGNSVNGDGSNLGDEWNKVVIISAGDPDTITPDDNKQTNVFVIALIIMGIGALAATRVSKWN